MKVKEIRELTDKEIEARIKDEGDKLLRLRLNHAISAIENPSDITSTRRAIARLKTVLRERQLTEVEESNSL
ncbi:MAG: 50S ribosomal protein L29 [Bacteroidota bacterium]